MAAAVVMGEVFENEDLVKLILRKTANWSFLMSGAAADTLRIRAVERARLCLTLATVNWLFFRLTKGFAQSMMQAFREDALAFRDLAFAMCDKALPGSIQEQLATVRERSLWPAAVYGTSLMEDAFCRVDNSVAFTQEFQFLLSSRMPTHIVEMLDMLERRCVCCNAYNVKVTNKPGAWGLHPYAGPLRGDANDTYVYLQGSWLPHTCESHFVEVLFFRNAELQQFDMHMYNNYADRVPGEEIRFNHFIRAARGQFWFRPNIARLFDERNPRLRFVDSHHGGGGGDCQFVASICMYAPRMELTDWSLQSIFGLTRACVTAMVRRGSAMAREERLLK
ncbi:MAG: hypothetical protein CMI29_04560 [Opitutae bacterium]|nr:hypothetical protein [Opitutae bacterium]|tara:strand:- start:739 stop:1746 length:1008 start_codon:yes stop_codon:yes gene_type:complete